MEGFLPSDTEQSLVFSLQNNGRAVRGCRSPAHTLNIYRAVIYVDVSFVCLDTRAHLIHVYLFCLTVSRNKGLQHCRVFMDLWIYTEHPRSHVLQKGTEWLQQSVSAENLHGNKSYNLSPVCTLDWLRAITLTKKAVFPFFLFLLLAVYYTLCLVSN